MASLEEQIEATKHTLETLEEEKRKRDEESERFVCLLCSLDLSLSDVNGAIGRSD